MPSFPQPGSVTICEINRSLITADSISDGRARESYGKVIGAVFSPVPFQPENLLLPSLENSGGQDRRNVSSGLSQKGWLALPAKISDAFKHVFHPNDVHLLPEVNLQAVCWHQHKLILAFISGRNQVTVCDYEDSEGKDPIILDGDSQTEVKLVEWRPNGGITLSVACKGGICLWAASYPGNSASVRYGAAPFVGTISRGSGIRWTLVDFLKSHDEQISALSWSPDGRYRHLDHMRVHLSPYGMFLKVWELLFDVDWGAFQSLDGHRLEITFLLLNLMGLFIFGKQTHGHRHLGLQVVALSREQLGILMVV